MPNRKTPNPPGNRLLAMLAPKILAGLRRDFQEVDLPLRQILSEPGKPFEHVYFPDTGMISVVQHLEDGGVTEVGLVGREGFLGVPVVLGGKKCPTEAMVQLAGKGVRMLVSKFQNHLHREGGLQKSLLLYVQASQTLITQTAVCNARHSLVRRLGRWLLETSDRALSNDLPLSYEFLGMMLSTHRPSVTLALGKYKAANAIAIGHGHITIRDRAGVESMACECYGIVRAEYQRLLA